MDFSYITLDASFTAVISIPESQSGDTVTYAVYLASDKSTFASGSMTFVAGINWKCSFTPTSGDVYILEVTNSTLDVVYTAAYEATGAGSSPTVSTTGNDLTTRANFKQNFDISGTAHDDIISDVITTISKEIQTYCDRLFNDQTFTEYYDGDGDSQLLLRNYPIISITSIYEDADRDWTDSDNLIAAADYFTHEDDGIVELFSDTFSEGSQNIRVIYKAGYTTIPDDLRQACEELVMAAYIERTTSINVEVGDDVLYKPEILRKKAWKTIQKYRRKNIK